MSDGLYLGTVISTVAPTQYIQMNSDGIAILTPQDLDLTASGDIDATASGDIDLNASGDANITASGNVIISGDSIQAGPSPGSVCLQPLITWITGTLIPALAAASIVVSNPPADSLSTTFEAS